MTTEDRKLTAVEWRLYIVALLALIYVVTWRALARPAALSTTAPPAGTIATDTPAPPRLLAPAVTAPPPPVRTVAAPPRAVTVRATAPQTAAPAKRVTQRPRVIRMQPVRRVRTRSS